MHIKELKQRPLLPGQSSASTQGTVRKKDRMQPGLALPARDPKGGWWGSPQVVVQLRWLTDSDPAVLLEEVGMALT